MQNSLILDATVTREEALRYTPTGLAVVEMWLKHQSQQAANGFERGVMCEIQAVLIGEKASQYAGMLAGSNVLVSGFLSQRSYRNPRLVLNIQDIELKRGE